MKPQKMEAPVVVSLEPPLAMQPALCRSHIISPLVYTSKNWFYLGQNVSRNFFLREAG